MKTDAWPRLIGLAAIVLTVAITLPGIRNIFRIRSEIRAFQATLYTGDIVIRGASAVDVPDTLREADVLRGVVRELAGDHPGRLGDLTLGPPTETGFGREVTFAVDGRASFPQIASHLAWLEGLWPLAHVTSFVLQRPDEGVGLEVRFVGRFEFRRRLPAPPDLHALADVPIAPGRDPFVFGEPGPGGARPPADPPDVAPAADAEPAMPGFQGSMILGGAKVAFFDGKAYRPGERVGGRLLLDVVNGRPVLASKEDSR